MEPDESALVHESREAAETLAIQALAFIAEEPERLERLPRRDRN